MEVVSAVSSVLSLLDVIARSSSAIHHLISNWRDAPAEIFALGNEVNDSKAVLNQACHLLHQLDNAPPARSDGPDIKSSALAIRRQLDQAVPVWIELQDILRLFEGKEDQGLTCPRAVRFRWLKYQKKIGQMRKNLRARRLGLLELVVTSSAYQNQAVEMHLRSLPTDIRASQQLSAENWDHLHQKLIEIEKSMTLISEKQESDARELVLFLSGCRAVFQSIRPLSASSSGVSSTDIDALDREQNRANKREVEAQCKYANCQVCKQVGSTPTDPIGVCAKYTTFSDIILRQIMLYSNKTGQCARHSRNWGWQARHGTSALFKYVFGSLLVGYSTIPTPNINCGFPTWPQPVQKSTISIRYSLPTWVANRLLIFLISTHAPAPKFTLSITRRVPYVPGNIFSLINSRDFVGAIALLQDGSAHVNDVETRHGNSVLAAALRHPALGSDFVRFIEFMLRRQVDPHILNDEGESSWYFAARLMLPNTPPALASTELQSQLHRLFPHPCWDSFQFTHLHMVVAGIRPLNLEKVLENPSYRSQINAIDALGQTPLELAAMLGDYQAMEALLLAGAEPSPHTTSATSFDPLRRAVRSQSVRCVELLLMASVKPFALDSRGATLLHTAAAGRNNLSLTRTLLLAGVPLESQNVHNCNPLSFTPLNDNYEVAQFLLSQGAELNNVDKDGDTPFTEAVRLNAHRCLRLFLERGANIRTTNKRGWTVLHFAAAYGDAATMQILGRGDLYGLESQALDMEGYTSMDRLMMRRHTQQGVFEAFEGLLKNIIPEGAASGGHHRGENRGKHPIHDEILSREGEKEIVKVPQMDQRSWAKCSALLVGSVVLFGLFYCMRATHVIT